LVDAFIIHEEKPQITEFIEKYRRRWKEHDGRKLAVTIPEKFLKYQPREKRSLGRPLKRWKDCALCNARNRPQEA
jgi:hypothetical protein